MAIKPSVLANTPDSVPQELFAEFNRIYIELKNFRQAIAGLEAELANLDTSGSPAPTPTPTPTPSTARVYYPDLTVLLTCAGTCGANMPVAATENGIEDAAIANTPVIGFALEAGTPGKVIKVLLAGKLPFTLGLFPGPVYLNTQEDSRVSNNFPAAQIKQQYLGYCTGIEIIVSPSVQITTMGGQEYSREIFT